MIIDFISYLLRFAHILIFLIAISPSLNVWASVSRTPPFCMDLNNSLDNVFLVHFEQYFSVSIEIATGGSLISPLCRRRFSVLLETVLGFKLLPLVGLSMVSLELILPGVDWAPKLLGGCLVVFLFLDSNQVVSLLGSRSRSPSSSGLQLHDQTLSPCLAGLLHCLQQSSFCLMVLSSCLHLKYFKKMKFLVFKFS